MQIRERVMKKIVLMCLLGLFIVSCDSSSSTSSEPCYYNNHQLITGPQGGCYYWNSNGNKTYVDSDCCISCNC